MTLRRFQRKPKTLSEQGKPGTPYRRIEMRAFMTARGYRLRAWHPTKGWRWFAFKKKRPVDGSPAAMDGQIDLEEAIAKFGERVELNDDEKAKGYTAAFVKDGSRVAMQVRI